jgi:hypothetical protein
MGHITPTRAFERQAPEADAWTARTGRKLGKTFTSGSEAVMMRPTPRPPGTSDERG